MRSDHTEFFSCSCGIGFSWEWRLNALLRYRSVSAALDNREIPSGLIWVVKVYQDHVFLEGSAETNEDRGKVQSVFASLGEEKTVLLEARDTHDGSRLCGMRTIARLDFREKVQEDRTRLIFTAVFRN